jgi:hypothetical protein
LWGGKRLRWGILGRNSVGDSVEVGIRRELAGTEIVMASARTILGVHVGGQVGVCGGDVIMTYVGDIPDVSTMWHSWGLLAVGTGHSCRELSSAVGCSVGVIVVDIVIIVGIHSCVWLIVVVSHSCVWLIVVVVSHSCVWLIVVVVIGIVVVRVKGGRVVIRVIR